MLTVNAYATLSPSEPLVKTIHHSPRRRCPRCADRTALRGNLSFRHPHRAWRVGAADLSADRRSRDGGDRGRDRFAGHQASGRRPGRCRHDGELLPGVRVLPQRSGAVLRQRQHPAYASVDRDGTITQGGYSTHVVVTEDFVLKIPDAIPFETAVRCCAPGSRPTRRCVIGPPAPERLSQSSVSAA